jgi:predicted kinase
METLRTRLQTRKGDISDATADLLVQQQANTDIFNETETKYAIAINTEAENWQSGLDSWLN